MLLPDGSSTQILQIEGKELYFLAHILEYGPQNAIETHLVENWVCERDIDQELSKGSPEVYDQYRKALQGLKSLEKEISDRVRDGLWGWVLLVIGVGVAFCGLGFWDRVMLPAILLVSVGDLFAILGGGYFFGVVL